VRPLVPLLRRCIESALWVGTASLAILQIEAMAGLAAYGPRVMEAIGLFFIARVAIELGHLLIDQRLLNRTDLDETRAKRNATFAPLLKTLFRGGVFFAAGVLMLGALGFNPMPFLAGAGILGVVIGLGAQPMINDLVSGFFVIFENQFLLGDTIEVEDARGKVEAIDFRTTRIRDIEGRVHLIRNGDLKRVVNHSKDYSNAVVRIGVPIDSHLGTVQTALERADQRLRESIPDDITGPTTLTLAESIDDGCCITRTIIRTKPSRHWAIGAELRKMIIEELHIAGITPGLPRQQIEINQAPPAA
jgi:moderate conductance mechanosensitive channel